MKTITKEKNSEEIQIERPSSVSPHPGHRLSCPKCGNDVNFFEIAEDVTLTTRYIQNSDGSFTPRSDDSRILGDIKLYCGECDADLSRFHNHFVEMLF